MKQQIITIIEKEDFINDLDQSYIDIMWDSLNNKYYISLSLNGESVSAEVKPNFIIEYTELIVEFNSLMVMSDSDIVNFKNNLIKLINNYFN